MIDPSTVADDLLEARHPRRPDRPEGSAAGPEGHALTPSDHSEYPVDDRHENQDHARQDEHARVLQPDPAHRSQPPLRKEKDHGGLQHERPPDHRQEDRDPRPDIVKPDDRGSDKQAQETVGGLLWFSVTGSATGISYGHGPQLASNARKSLMPTPPPSKSHLPGLSHCASNARKSVIPTLPSLSPTQSHGQAMGLKTT